MSGPQPILTADDIRPWHRRANDYLRTVELIRMISSHKQNRSPFYLTFGDVNEIRDWKLDKQRGRTADLWAQNKGDIVSHVTRFSFSINHQDEEYETSMRLGALCLLRGVGVAVASAILTLSDPQRYAVVDRLNWLQLFGAEKEVTSVSEYLHYLRCIRSLAMQLGWTPQEADHAIWARAMAKRSKSIV